MTDSEKKAQEEINYFKERGLSLVITTETVPVTTQKTLWHITLNDDVLGEPYLSDHVVDGNDVIAVLKQLKEDVRDDSWKKRQKPVTE